MTPGPERDDQQARATGRLLAGLVRAATDAELEDFRRLRAGDATIELDKLRKARDLVDAVADVIGGSDSAPWRRVEAAWAILCDHAGVPAVMRQLDEPTRQPAEDAPGAEAEPSHSSSPTAATASPAVPPPALAAASAPTPPPRAPLPPPPPFTPPPMVARPLAPPGPSASPWAQPDPLAPARAAETPAPSSSGVGDVDRTAAVDIAAVLGGLVLPFREGDASPLASSVDDSAPPPGVGDTAELDLGMLRAVREPFPMHGKAPMDAERYAALVARTEAAPEDAVARVHAEYGIVDRLHRIRIDDEMRAALEREPSLQQGFAYHLARWRAWLREGGR